MGIFNLPNGLPGTSFAQYLQQEIKKDEQERFHATQPPPIKQTVPVKDLSGTSFKLKERQQTPGPATKAAPTPGKRKVVLEDE